MEREARRRAAVAFVVVAMTDIIISWCVMFDVCLIGP